MDGIPSCKRFGNYETRFKQDHTVGFCPSTKCCCVFVYCPIHRRGLTVLKNMLFHGAKSASTRKGSRLKLLFLQVFLEKVVIVFALPDKNKIVSTICRYGFLGIQGGSGSSWRYPKMVGLFHGKSIYKLDDDWGYPYDETDTSINCPFETSMFCTSGDFCVFSFFPSKPKQNCQSSIWLMSFLPHPLPKSPRDHRGNKLDSDARFADSRPGTGEMILALIGPWWICPENGGFSIAIGSVCMLYIYIYIIYGNI